MTGLLSRLNFLRHPSSSSIPQAVTKGQNVKEPIYVAQNGDLTDPKAVFEWFRERSQYARDNHGCDHFRYSEHPHIPNLVLVEGWQGYPDNWDYGEPRWALTAKAAA